MAVLITFPGPDQPATIAVHRKAERKKCTFLQPNYVVICTVSKLNKIVSSNKKKRISCIFCCEFRWQRSVVIKKERTSKHIGQWDTKSVRPAEFRGGKHREESANGRRFFFFSFSPLKTILPQPLFKRNDACNCQRAVAAAAAEVN